MTTGRPTIYSTELAAEICRRLAEGESARSVCRDDSMPALSTVYKWLHDIDGFSEQYDRAKQDSADTYAETISEIGDKVLAGEYEPSAAKVALDAYKWTAARLKPKKYGDKLDVEHTGTVILHRRDGL